LPLALRRLAAALWLSAAGASLAGAVSPRTGDLAMCVGFGWNAPVDDGAFGGRFVAAGSQELYWTAANSVRGTLGFLDLPAEAGSGRGERSAIFLAGNVSHNWLRGAVFPYVTGGVGLYAVEERTGPGTDTDGIELGMNGGAGLEFRLGDVLTLRLEAMVHALTGDSPRAIATGTLGVKFYY
jgi:hypothetical protein